MAWQEDNDKEYLEGRAKQRKNRKAVGILLIVIGVVCGGICIVNLATGGERNFASIAPIAACVFTLAAGFDKLR